jgi:hypothetical protein
LERALWALVLQSPVRHFSLAVLASEFEISRAYLMVPVLILLAAAIVKFVPAKVDQQILDDLEL